MLLRSLDLFGTGVFAIAGALVAGRKRMDIFGVIVVAIATAIGGGTIRDLVLQRAVFWVGDPAYLYVGIGAAILTFLVGPLLQRQLSLLLIADALGLAVFTIIGSQKALDAGAPWLVVIIMGVMTGVAGGIIRDILCNELPLIFMREIYATASFAGAALFIILRHYAVPPELAAAGAAALVLAIRLAAIRWRLSLPVFRGVESK